MKKAIALIRTSTVRQEIESQKEQVLQMCYDDGLNEDEVVIIGNAGASAIKLDEAYQRNMDELYKTIKDNQSIRCVYAWAIDRIGRRESILHSFREFLVQHKIQLKIKANNLTLLDSEGKEDFGVKLQFSLYATLAAAEMENKKERFKRAKERNRKQGKYNGGPRILFGYKVVDGYFVEDEYEANIVREIYEEYATGQWSIRRLCVEINERGYVKQAKKIPHSAIRTILYNYIKYCGEDDRLNYPSIMSKDLAYKVKELLSHNQKALTRSPKHSYFGSGLLKCRCGQRMIVSCNHYKCVTKSSDGRKLTGGLKPCNETKNNIACSILDGLLWSIALECHRSSLEDAGKAKKKDIIKQLAILDKKLGEFDKRLGEFEVKRKRLASSYILDALDDKEMDELKAKLDEQENLIRDKASICREQRNRLQRMMHIDDKAKDAMFNFINVLDLSMNAKEQEMNSIVKQYILNVEVGEMVEGMENMSGRTCHEILVDTIYGTRVFGYLYAARKSSKLWEMVDGEWEEYWCDKIERK